MYGVYVHSTRTIPYARAIVRGLKTCETRNRDVLRDLVGQRVAIIETGCRSARIVGYVDIDSWSFCNHRNFNKYFSAHLVPPGSKYDCKPNCGKYLYWLKNPIEVEPMPVPANAKRHGYSFCEF